MSTTEGTVVLTGANGSAGLHASEYLLKHYSHLTIVCTVRNAKDDDPNTQKLRKIISLFPNAKVSIHEIDFSTLTAVHEFADTLASDIAAHRYPPLTAIICNAAYWNLVGPPVLTVDGWEKGIQIGHIAQVALVLRLLESYGPDGGRVEMISSILHFRKKTPLSPYLPDIPADLNDLVHPPDDANKLGRGYTAYSNVKLVNTVWAYSLNRYLQQNPKFHKISAVAMNPGNLFDSRVYATNTPFKVRAMMHYMITPLVPLIRLLGNRDFRSIKEAGKDMVELAVNKSFEGARGYYTFLKEDQPDPVVLDKTKQELVWVKSAEWSGIGPEKVPLEST